MAGDGTPAAVASRDAFGEALAFLAWLMPQSHWVTIYRKSLRRAGVAIVIGGVWLMR